MAPYSHPCNYCAVQVGDTGIDMSNCYFIDDKYRPGSLSTYFVGNPPRMYLPYHRKVVQYVLPESACKLLLIRWIIAAITRVRLSKASFRTRSHTLVW